MGIRRVASTSVGAVAARALRDVNARHPWSHNDYFHSWILANLPRHRRSALDVGCGQGALSAALSPHFEQVVGIDLDADMREQAAARCGGLHNVTITDDDLASMPADSFDLVTMVAVLHHLDVKTALEQMRHLLTPGGRLLVVGLAVPRSITDHVWDLVSMVTNPLIGYVGHPWPSPDGVQPPPFPVKDPSLTFEEIGEIIRDVMPGAVMRHRVGFRHTIAWTKPDQDRCT